MRRREFLGVLGGAAAAWPLAARAQQAERDAARRACSRAAHARTIADAQANNAAFLEGLQRLGWTDGRNVRIDYRWGLGQA